MGLKAVATAVTSGSLTPTQMAAFDNINALVLPKWRARVGSIKAAMANPVLPTVQGTVLCIGDSITSGAYSNNSASGDWKVSSWPNQLAQMFNASGVNAFCDSFMGYSDIARDSRLTLSAPWVKATGDFSVGGDYLFSTAAGTSTGLAFTPLNPVDTFKLWTIKVASAGVLGYKINAGSESTLDLNAASALASATITGTLGINTLNLRRVSGGNVFSVGVQAWNSTISAVQFVNAGWDGATTTNWNSTTNPWSPGQFAAVAAQLTIIMLGINDLLPSNAIPATTTKTNIQALITSALTTGDVLLVCENPAVVASTISLAAQTVYWDAVKALANTNNLAVVDIFGRWVSFEYSNPLGYYFVGAYPANLHPVGQGYSDITQAIFNVIGNP